jgi:hypothetical protein
LYSASKLRRSTNSASPTPSHVSLPGLSGAAPERHQPDTVRVQLEAVQQVVAHARGPLARREELLVDAAAVA